MRCQHADVAAATNDVGVGGDVSAVTQGLDQDIARTIGADACVVIAAINRDCAVIALQHQVCATAQIFLCKI